MKKCKIFYFSGTGNTERACKKLSEELEKYDFCVETQSIDEIGEIKDLEYDVIGIGYPIHGFNAPSIIDEFVEKLPKVDKKPLFVVRTGGEPLKINDASSMYFMKKALKKGYAFCGDFHYIMPYNIIFRHTDDMVALMRESLYEKVKEDAKEIAELRERIPSYPTKARIVAALVRIEHPAIKVIGKGFKVNENKCIRCNKCMNACPTKNISLKNGKYKFGNSCLGCMRCAFRCPKDALKIGILNSWKVNGEYDFEKVEHSENPHVTRYCHKSYVKYFYGENTDNK